MVIFVVVPVEKTAVVRPGVEEVWVVGNDLGRQCERQLPGREAGLLAKVESVMTIFGCRRSGVVVRRLVGRRRRSGVGMKRGGNRHGKTQSGER